MLGEKAVGDHRGDFFIRGVLHLHYVDIVVPGDEVKLNALHDVHEGDESACGSCAACPAGAENVAFEILRRNIEEDKGKGWNVDAPGCHICGHEKANLAFTDLRHDTIPVALGEIGGEHVRVVSESSEYAADIVYVAFCIAEDYGRRRIFHLENPDQGAVLVHGVNGAEIMLHLGHVDFLLGEGKHGRLGHEFLSEVEDMRRVGGREEIRMDAVIRKILLDLVHIGVETDGEHAVSFVKDENADAGKIKRVAQNMIQNTSRRADDELGAPFESVELFLVAYAAIQRDTGDAGSFKKA